MITLSKRTFLPLCRGRLLSYQRYPSVRVHKVFNLHTKKQIFSHTNQFSSEHNKSFHIEMHHAYTHAQINKDCVMYIYNIHHLNETIALAYLTDSRS